MTNLERKLLPRAWFDDQTTLEAMRECLAKGDADREWRDLQVVRYLKRWAQAKEER